MIDKQRKLDFDPATEHQLADSGYYLSRFKNYQQEAENDPEAVLTDLEKLIEYGIIGSNEVRNEIIGYIKQIEESEGSVKISDIIEKVIKALEKERP